MKLLFRHQILLLIVAQLKYEEVVREYDVLPVLTLKKLHINLPQRLLALA
jgi:hypothetical protein